MKAGISGRKILKRNRNKLYTLINGVYTQMLYEELDVDGNYYYSDVLVTDPEKLAKQSAILERDVENKTVLDFEEVVTTTPQGTTRTTVTTNVQSNFIFSYKRNVGSRDSKGFYVGVRVTEWKSIKGDLTFSQSTVNDQPFVGNEKGGIVGRSTPFFNGKSSFLNTTDVIRLQNNFTIFVKFSTFRLQRVRLLGNSSDSNVFISFNENADANFHIGITSGNSYIIPTTTKLQDRTIHVVTIVRKSNVLTLRIDGVEQGTVSVTNDDLIIDNMGKAIDTVNTFAGNISDVQFWDGALSKNLDRFETALIADKKDIRY